MKKTTIVILSFLLATCFIACIKEPLNTALDASKISSIKKGEPVMFKLLIPSLGDSVTWHVDPSANTVMQIWGDSVSILFNASGNYTVTATYRKNSVASANVTVTDSVYIGDVIFNDTANSISALVPDEEIKIFLYHWPGLDSNKITGLVFQAQTTHSYNCSNNYLLSNMVKDSNGYMATYYGIGIREACTGGVANAQTSDYINNFAEGSNTLTIVVNGKTYSGTIVKTGTKFTIHWPYTSGVTISPTSL